MEAKQQRSCRIFDVDRKQCIDVKQAPPATSAYTTVLRLFLLEQQIFEVSKQEMMH